MAEIDSDRVAIQSVLMQLFAFQSLLLGFGLGLRDIRGLLRSIRTVSIDGLALGGGHPGRSIRLGTRHRLLLLKLLHLGSEGVLALLVFRIPSRLHLLLGLKTSNLLRIRSRGSHWQCARRRGFLLAADEARHIGNTNQGDNSNQRDHDRRALLDRSNSFALRRNSGGRIFIDLGHG